MPMLDTRQFRWQRITPGVFAGTGGFRCVRGCRLQFGGYRREVLVAAFAKQIPLGRVERFRLRSKANPFQTRQFEGQLLDLEFAFLILPGEFCNPSGELDHLLVPGPFAVDPHRL